MRIYENVMLNLDGCGDRAITVVPLADVAETERANVGLAHEVHLLGEEKRRLERDNARLRRIIAINADSWEKADSNGHGSELVETMRKLCSSA